MLYFRPIVYSDADLRAFKLSAGASSIREGRLCYVSGAALNVITASVYSGASPATLYPGTAAGSGTVSLFDAKKYFPVYREDQDRESVSGTIDAGEFCIGFEMTTGNEFEVHKSLVENGALASFSVGAYVCLGSTGKYVHRGGNKSTNLVLGRCLGTFGGKYVRVKVI